MQKSFANLGKLTAIALICATQVHAQSAEQTSDTPATSVHAHSSSDKNIYNGIFEDHEVKARTMADWQGDWKSLHPYLQDGTLDPFIQFKVEHEGKSSEDYRAFLDTGFKTDFTNVSIHGSEVSFMRGEKTIKAQYETGGYEILDYGSGKRSLRYVFIKSAGAADAPTYIQFSDHIISPKASEHFHLYWGEDLAEISAERTNWPTYYPIDISGSKILDYMLAHAH
jgi:zinc transport system substrate-binding protein